MKKILLEEKKIDPESITKAKASLKKLLINIRGIRGVGLSHNSNNQDCLLVNVAATASKEVGKKIPSKHEGFDVLIQTVSDASFTQ